MKPCRGLWSASQTTSGRHPSGGLLKVKTYERCLDTVFCEKVFCTEVPGNTMLALLSHNDVFTSLSAA